MKKILAVLLAVMTVLSVSVMLIGAADADTAKVYVTVADKDGKLALAYEQVTVTDIDNDNVLTINDALYAAHEKFYQGGAAQGYATEVTKYGLSLTKLWGATNGYNFGYMVNDKSAWSMTDPVKADDHVAAYVFTDNKTFADKYAYFDRKTAELEEGDKLTLTLKKNDFDADWNPITLPVAGAELTVNGEPTGVVTDENGTATLTVTVKGKSLISATAKDQVLVPPVCLVSIPQDEATPDERVLPTGVVIDDDTTAETVAPTVAPTDTTATKDEATKDSSTKDSSSSSTPKTGDTTKLWLWILIAAGCLCGIIGAGVFYVKRYVKK